MGRQDMLENGAVGNGAGTASLHSDGLEQMIDGGKESMNLSEDILQDFDVYLDDLDNYLVVSRMVSDSVIKGMVGAVEQEATEKIRAKEMELAKLKEYLKVPDMNVNRVELLGSSSLSNEPESVQHFTFLYGFKEHEKMTDSLIGLRSSVEEQFKKLKKDICGVRDRNSLRRMGSGSELVGLGGILQEKESGSWVHVDKSLNNLKTTIDSIFAQVDDILQLSKASLVEQEEKDLLGELEKMMMQNLLRSVLEDFENKLWDQNSQFYNSQIEKLTEISSLRADLDDILKSLLSTESGHLISHGSHDILRDHVVSSKSLCEGNEKVEDSRTDVPDNFEAAQLKHFTKEEMVSYFNSMITKMKRDHESILQVKTEELFTLKAEFLRLRERGSSVPHRKDKELDAVRKKIPDILWKLDGILLGNEKLPAITSKDENLCSLKNRLESLLSENCRLRDSLACKKNEVKCLSSQVSDATEKMLKHSLAEEKMLKLIDNLNLVAEDVDIEASIREEVYKCFLKDLSEDSHMQLHMVREIYDTIFREATVNAESTCMFKIEDSDLESLITQELYAVVCVEAIKDSEKRFNEEYLKESETRISLEQQASQRESDFTLKAEENIRLKEELVALKKSLEEKVKIASDVVTALAKERNQFDLVSQELNSLREQVTKQQKLVSENSEELDLVKGQLLEATKQIEVFREESHLLNQKLEQKVEELNKVDDERRMILALSEERQSNLLLLEAREKDLMKQMDAVNGSINELSTMLADFECKVTGRMSTNELRLEHSQAQMKSLVKKANLLRKRTLVCQQSLEKRCSDLQMAEAEVDLLGDEVDALLGLLEKIYIALDHYSPILQYYPGVIEILKLIRRELGGESTKAV
ncbi:PREDICTED: WPP domain-associated protein [Ipomoea nil]|uniref:WPP domain-associated protein n=1 Tax=Ipomoea nil TaxID=35883 RepID=UPI00090129AE|nr:PREDICTED: WPP domain-associated protein [Ipomoea nil]XP_019185933.1 PREDICTED: WPP domain-associated protein [Ipomoea nil]